MKYCPLCDAEYSDAHASCSVCGVDLVPAGMRGQPLDERQRKEKIHVVWRGGDPLAVSEVINALREADIGFRMITGGCFPSHDVIRHFDYELVGDIPNARLAHNQGFFVGNCPADLTPQLTRLRDVLESACRK